MDLETQLTRAVRRFADATPARRRATPWLRIGSPGGRHLGLADDPGYDAGLRADVVERVLDGFDPASPPPTAWLTRTGGVAPGDVDLAWLAACREGYGRHGITLTSFYLVTRSAWSDLLDDENATTVRRRRQRSSPGVDGLVAVHPLAVVEQREPQRLLA
jgi:hypothetical protein